MCVYIYIYIYIYRMCCMLACVCIRTHMNLRVTVCVCVCGWVCVCACICVWQNECTSTTSQDRVLNAMRRCAGERRRVRERKKEMKKYAYSTDEGDRTWLITTVKISNKFSRESPYISNTFSWETPNFHTSFHVCKRSPRHSKDPTIKSLDLEIQMFSVWFPPWVDRPTQWKIYIPLLVNRFQEIILLIAQYKYLKSCSEDFILQNLILRTRSCGTAYITQHSWLFHFRQTEICRVEIMCTSGVPVPKRHFGGASP